jgi:Integrase core domain
MRDELLKGEEFDSLLQPRVVVAGCVEQYDTLRPHRGLGMMTPSAYAARCREEEQPTDELDQSEKAGARPFEGGSRPHASWAGAQPARMASGRDGGRGLA